MCRLYKNCIKFVDGSVVYRITELGSKNFIQCLPVQCPVNMQLNSWTNCLEGNTLWAKFFEGQFMFLTRLNVVYPRARGLSTFLCARCCWTIHFVRRCSPSCDYIWWKTTWGSREMWKYLCLKLQQAQIRLLYQKMMIGKYWGVYNQIPPLFASQSLWRHWQRRFLR